MNDIPSRQNAPGSQELMKAREHLYARATRLQIAQLFCTVVFPMIFAIVGLLTEAARPYVALAAFAMTVLDLAALDRAQRQHLRVAARISEQFDCEVLQMSWKRFVAGRQIDPETIAEAAASWRGRPEKVLDWYPLAVGAAPLHLARLICQRTNLWYDSNLRRRWSRAVLALAMTTFMLLLVAGFLADLSLLGFSATILAPATPLMIWAFREHYRQLDAAQSLENIKDEAETLWDQVKADQVGLEECLIRSREFQNAIFARRTLNPLIFPLIYPLLRDRMEVQMNKGAEQYLKEIGCS
ncbi:MAG TPA: S-4TM family putative pore-forming effector [Methyloceanibacter sp.]|nr:S-4TM family putative pore-forming effector [Methyloceanibacter sp.]